MFVRTLSVGLVILALAQSAWARDVKIAIWRLKPLGLDSVTADRLEELLRAETSRLPKYSLQTRHRTESILSRSQHAKLRKCGGQTECLCAIGKALRVNKLMTGVIGALGDDYTFDLKLIDMAQCREVGRRNKALSGEEKRLIPALRENLYKLVVPELFVGSMIVEVPMEGAEVLVDGEPKGLTPLAQPISGLRPSAHKLQIRKQGFSDFEASVEVRFQQTIRVKVDLHRSALTDLTYEEEIQTPGPVPVEVLTYERSATTRILAWSAASLAASAVVVGALCGWRAKVIEDDLERAVKEVGLDGSHQDDVDRGETMAMWSNIGWGLAGSAAALSVILFLVDGFAPEGSSTTRLAPVVGAEGAGAMIQWTF